jgi:ABC-type sugar transport system permease subunit
MATTAELAPTQTRTDTRSGWTSSSLSDGQFAWLLTLPVLVTLLAVVGYPTLYSLWMSFHRIDLIFKRTEYVGWQNYLEALASPAVAHALQVTIVYTALVTIFALVIAVGGALILNEKFRGRGIVMTLVILPWAVSLYATAIVWKYLYSPDWGMFNAILLGLGIVDRPFNFLSERLAVPALAVAHAWQIAPLGMYFVLATLQVIPEDLYKAAKVDRLGAVGRFRHVVFPYIKAPLLIVMVLVTVEAARAFDLVFFMTGGGPGDVSTTLTWEVYRVFYRNSQYGEGSALGWLLVILTTIITTIYFVLLFWRRGQRPGSGQPVDAGLSVAE